VGEGRRPVRRRPGRPRLRRTARLARPPRAGTGDVRRAMHLRRAVDPVRPGALNALLGPSTFPRRNSANPQRLGFRRRRCPGWFLRYRLLAAPPTGRHAGEIDLRSRGLSPPSAPPCDSRSRLPRREAMFGRPCFPLSADPRSPRDCSQAAGVSEAYTPFVRRRRRLPPARASSRPRRPPPPHDRLPGSPVEAARTTSAVGNAGHRADFRDRPCLSAAVTV